jgi:hypothetical protein
MDDSSNAGKSSGPLSMKTQLICGLLMGCATLAASLGYQRLTPTAAIFVAIIAATALIVTQRHTQNQRTK